MRIAYGSDVGRKRAKNEDSVGNFKNRSNVVFVILADGLGAIKAVKLLLKWLFLILDICLNKLSSIILMMPKPGWKKSFHAKIR